jgi:sterol desaturase/sphingolipid hydroxylase (fatty acid hydroxylase superfamily)
MADQPIDMFIKSSPILWIPFLFPIWDVALIGTFATMNFLYGTYLHAGFDPPWMPSPHSRLLVSAWHHNEHHAGSPITTMASSSASPTSCSERDYLNTCQ